MKLAFKNKWSDGFTEKDVPIMLRIGTLEDIKQDKGLDFGEIGDLIKTDPDTFYRLILYYGYLTHCQKHYTKPIYRENHAFYWYLKMDLDAKKELNKEMQILYGEMIGNGAKKKVKQSH